MSDRSDSPDDDNQSRKRHLVSQQNESITPSKRSKSSSAFSYFFAPISSFIGMFRGEKAAEKSTSQRVFDVSDDESVDEEIFVVPSSPRKTEPSGPIVFLSADNGRLVAGVDENEEDDDVVLEKHVQNNVEVADDDSDDDDVQEIAQPSVSELKEQLERTFEVQLDEDQDLSVQFVKIVKTPNRDLQNARLYQNEIIFLNGGNRDAPEEERPLDQFASANEQVFASPTPDESASRSTTPNDWNSMSPYSSSTKGVRDFWRRSAAKKSATKRAPMRQHLFNSTVVQRVGLSQRPIQKASKQRAPEAALAKYVEYLQKCGYLQKPETKDTSLKFTKGKTKSSANDLIAKAKHTISGIRSSRSNTPTSLSRESSVIFDRSIAGSSRNQPNNSGNESSRCRTPSTSSDYSARNPNYTDMLSQIESLALRSSERTGRYQSIYEQSNRRGEELLEEMRIREGHRVQTKEERQEEVRKALAMKGIVVRPKVEKTKKDEFPVLPNSVDLLIEKAWSKALNKEEQFVDAFSIQICRKDLLTLSGLNWLNDNIVNYYMQLICQRSVENSNYPKIYAFNSFFYTNIIEKGYASVKRWTRKVDIFSYHLLLVPVHLGMHWCMAVIDVAEKRIEFYDSLYDGNTDVLPALRNYISSESMDKKKTAFDFSGWTIQQMTDIPRQKNGSDCGVFSCQFAEWASRRTLPGFTQQHMPYYRKRMVHEIVTKKLLATI
ncbi:unnamed protein product [Caenorhabditis sp. 36 PRJEB53466]|nr:unnamed protein product [Caenorhabditis sp. 36 PRJEB53466]